MAERVACFCELITLESRAKRSLPGYGEGQGWTHSGTEKRPSGQLGANPADARPLDGPPDREADPRSTISGWGTLSPPPSVRLDPETILITVVGPFGSRPPPGLLAASPATCGCCQLAVLDGCALSSLPQRGG